ncbi:DNA primase family protein [Candidatus Nitrososphaera sp. FF02]|uniref:DNA primase family protein n=1 Tax=Candidatus Nitrososphaera sp. FF02 TaxID=3398226 RepID=UPI0039EAAAD0
MTDEIERTLARLAIDAPVVSFGPKDEAEVTIMTLLKNPDVSEADKRGALVEEILHRLHLATLEDTGEILYYKAGVYVPGGEQRIKAELQTIAGFELTNHMRCEVLETIRNSTYQARSEFDGDPWIINLQNGLYSIKTGEFAPHSWAHLSMTQLPIEYEPEATCRSIIEFLYDIVQDPRDVPLILEYMGYCLLANKDLQKELVLTGPPDSGKSVLLFLMTAIFGSKNVSNVTMQQLSSNRFALAQLVGKICNIYADISHARLEDIERFKAIATADEVEAEKKGMQLFKFKPRAKLVYSANILPKPPITVDDSFYRRWMIIQCALREKHYFSGKAVVRDPKLLEKLCSPENLSGLLNLVVISARRLVQKQRFCKAATTDQTRELYDRLSNPVQLWIETCLDVDGEAELPIEVGYRNYVEFCRERKIGVTTKEWLGKALGELGFVPEQRGTGKNKKRVWVGLGTRNPPFPSLENKQTLLVEQGKETLRVPTEEAQA